MSETYWSGCSPNRHTHNTCDDLTFSRSFRGNVLPILLPNPRRSDPSSGRGEDNRLTSIRFMCTGVSGSETVPCLRECYGQHSWFLHCVVRVGTPVKDVVSLTSARR